MKTSDPFYRALWKKYIAIDYVDVSDYVPAIVMLGLITAWGAFKAVSIRINLPPKTEEEEDDEIS